MQKPSKNLEDQPSGQRATKSRSKRQQSTNQGKHKKKLLQKVDKKNKQEPHKLTEIVGAYTVQLENPLGKGTYGQVYIAYVTQKPDQIYACKYISNRLFEKQKVYSSGKSGIQQRLQSQIETLKRLSDCKYVVKFHDLIKDPQKGYYLFMEKCDNHLGNLLEKGKGLDQPHALNFFKQLLKGYKYLYDQGISHRDLKPENLLIKDGKYLKLSDFGFVKVHTSAELVLRSAQKGYCLAQSLVGSINYMAPDIIEAENLNKEYDPYKSDVWSMGIILYKMLYGKQPYHAQKVQQLLQKIKKQPLSIPAEPKVSKKITNLLKSLIQQDPLKRMTFRQLYKQIVSTQEDQEEVKTNEVKYTQTQKKLLFYNLLVTKLSYDSAHHATLREIGITEYQKYSSLFMTYIHEKRLALYQPEQKQIKYAIKKQIKSYQQIFYEPIKQTLHSSEKALNENGQLNKTQVKTYLRQLKRCIKQYKQRQMLHQQIQYFLLLLVLFCNLQRGKISFQYIYTIIENDEKLNLKKISQLIQVNLRQK